MKLKTIYLKTVRSTNDLAINLITKQNTKPTLIKSLVQTKGKGTMGKKWVSQKGNIFISIFFEIHRKKISFRQFAILNAFLIKKVIKKYTSEKMTKTGLRFKIIRWIKSCIENQGPLFYHNTVLVEGYRH